MPVASCPVCGESVRLPLDVLPADSSAQCPWCGEVISAQSWQRALPPMVQVFDRQGNVVESEQLLSTPPRLAITAPTSRGTAPTDEPLAEPHGEPTAEPHTELTTEPFSEPESINDVEEAVGLTEERSESDDGPSLILSAEEHEASEKSESDLALETPDSPDEADEAFDPVATLNARFGRGEAEEDDALEEGHEASVEAELRADSNEETAHAPHSEEARDEAFDELSQGDGGNSADAATTSDRKRVPIAKDQRSYYDRHEWGRRRQKLDYARVLKLALPTLVVLPLIAGMVAFSGIDLGFYPFDGSLKLSSNSDSESPGQEDSNGSSAIVPEETGDFEDDLLNPIESGPRTAKTAILTSASESDSTDQVKPNTVEPATEERPDDSVATIDPVPTTSGSTQDTTDDSHSSSDSSMAWLDDLVARSSDDSTTEPNVEDPSDEVEDVEPESASSGETEDAEEMASSVPPTSVADAATPPASEMTTAPEASLPSADGNRVAPTDHREEGEDPEEIARRERENLKNSLLVFPHEAPKPQKPTTEVVTEEALPTPTVEDDDTDSEELKLACEQAATGLSTLTAQSSGRDQAITYRDLARLGTLDFEPDSFAVNQLLGELASSDSLDLFKGLELKWARSSRRNTDGILLVGRLRSNGDQELWYETSGGEHIEVATAGEIARDIRSVAIGRIIEVEPEVRVELVAGTALE